MQKPQCCASQRTLELVFGGVVSRCRLLTERCRFITPSDAARSTPGGLARVLFDILTKGPLSGMRRRLLLLGSGASGPRSCIRQRCPCMLLCILPCEPSLGVRSCFSLSGSRNPLRGRTNTCTEICGPASSFQVSPNPLACLRLTISLRLLPGAILGVPPRF